MNATTRKAGKVSVWLDKTSEPGEGSWVVSLDDDHGTSTIATYTSKAKAIKDAAYHAANYGCQAVICDKHGVETVIAGA